MTLHLNSNLLAEWHPTKNGSLTPDMVTAGSNKKVWWLCSKGHEWEATIAFRSRGSGCPYCSGRKVSSGENDLAAFNPAVAAEWHPTKNGSLTPNMVTAGSNKKVWWLCSKGHEWEATVNNRNKGQGCPYCSGRKVSSGENDLAAFNPAVAAEWHPTKNGSLTPNMVTAGSSKKVWWLCSKGHEWEAVISSRNRGSGCPRCSSQERSAVTREKALATLNPLLATQWHPTKNGSLTPSMVTARSRKKVWWLCSKEHEWEAMICNRSNGNGCPRCSGQKVITGKSNLATRNPLLAAEWHPEKNGTLTPDMVAAHSGKKVWWLCSKGHEWEASVSGRSDGNGCPCCSGQKVIAGETDLATRNPLLATEWHPTKNGTLTPDMVTASSGKKVWWLCSKGHEWEASVVRRNKGNECPYCSSRKVKAGDNDLASLNPLLAAEWHPTKNGTLTPNMVTAGSGKRVWWLCAEGHEWEAYVKDRSKGRGCPYCSGQRVTVDDNDLATLNPSLAAEWHPTKNGTLTPNMVAAGSSKRVWWLCAEGHEWEAAVNNRNRGRGCPYCYRQSRTTRYNNLATRNPALAAEWHPTKNGTLTPNMVAAGSDKKVWWLCSKGHEWEALINSRNHGSGCPICVKRGRKPKSVQHFEYEQRVENHYMSNVNPDKVRMLTDFFIDLDNKRQSKLIMHAYKLSVEQNVERELKEKNGRLPLENELKEAVNARLSDSFNVMNMLLKLDETGLAAVAMLMEKLQPTSMTTEHDTVVTTTHRRKNLEQKLRKELPNADLAAAQSVVAKYEK